MIAASHAIEKDDAAQVLSFFRELFLKCMDEGIIVTLNDEDMTKVISDPATYMTYAYETRKEKKSELLWVSDSTCLAAGEPVNPSSSRVVNRLKAQMGSMYKNIQVQCKGDARSPQLFSQTISSAMEVTSAVGEALRKSLRNISRSVLPDCQSRPIFNLWRVHPGKLQLAFSCAIKEWRICC